MSFWDAARDADTVAKPLAADDLEHAFQQIRDAPPHPCSLGKHVLNPKALYSPGVYICGNCGTFVDVPYPLSEREGKGKA